jgi:hypothetical protein
VWTGIRGIQVEGGHPQESTAKNDSVHFRTEEDRSGCLLIGVVLAGLATTYLSLEGLRSGGLEFWWEGVKELLFLACGLAMAGTGLMSLVRGSPIDGLLVDGEGIVEKTKRFSAGRIYWREIRSVHLFNPTFLGIPMNRRFIGVDITDSYRQRHSTWKRLNFWLTRTFSRAPEIVLDAKNLSASREKVLAVLEDGLRRYELRSISEAKKLEPGE